jgi:leucyl aminopeptidase
MVSAGNVPPVQVEATTDAPLQTDADTIVVGLIAGEGVPHDVGEDVLSGLLEAGEAKASHKKLAVAHAEGKRWILVGLGERAELTPARARAAAAVAHGRAGDLNARTLCWEVPHKVDRGIVGALVEGTVLHAYRFDRYLSSAPEDDHGVERLIVSAHDDVTEAVRRAAVIATAQNRARDLQNAPANDMTPTILAGRAEELAGGQERLSVEIMGRDDLVARGMGAFAAVAQGTYEEPRLIALRYDGPAASGPLLGYVGKAVTFDSGGISIKPAAKMHEMKFDMSGGAAVLEAMGALAELEEPVRVLAVIGSTENMPSGRSMKPGDIVRAANGVSIEINNTDAEGRLVLADCLCFAREQGAERLVDIATLTGAVIVALGSTYAGLMANDDAWAAEVEQAAQRTGEDVWRLPLHPEFAELIKGRYADIVNAAEARKGSSITAAEFLKRFVDDVPWAHLDIAGTAWDQGRPEVGKGATGFGVRLLVELASAGAVVG